MMYVTGIEDGDTRGVYAKAIAGQGSASAHRLIGPKRHRATEMNARREMRINKKLHLQSFCVSDSLRQLLFLINARRH